ncbi:hypothetical protein Patl1_27213 [Pistacia atlantica]|uniref:Uncharacterized protein n=1 Tax=Pistacia atlantica TaxID=434234 RepID=A0ACC1BE88_9ROSI|nr:hypothetical protein Patl1_27213 [Pistacia atlantica]
MASRIRFSLNHLLHSSSLFIPSFKSNPFTLSKISKLSPSHSSFSTLNSTCQIKFKLLPEDSAEGKLILFLLELLLLLRFAFTLTEIHDMFTKYEWHDMVITERQERPPSGSFFAIKKHMMRDFKKDGHNWTKKKDGKLVQASYERLKVGNVEMVQCIYVHGQDNGNFQRRIYWMLDQEPLDIALFHYLEVKVSCPIISLYVYVQSVICKLYEEFTLPLLTIVLLYKF